MFVHWLWRAASQLSAVAALEGGKVLGRIVRAGRVRARAPQLRCACFSVMQRLVSLHDLRFTGASSTATADVKLQPLSQPHLRSTQNSSTSLAGCAPGPNAHLGFYAHIVCFDCVIQTDHVSRVPCHPSQVLTTVFAGHAVRQLVRLVRRAAERRAARCGKRRALPPLSRRCGP